jgi:hypothetical protein
MSVAFAIEVTRSAAEGRWRALATAIPAAGLGTAAVQLHAGPTFAIEGPPALRAAATLACALGAAALASASLRALRRGPGARAAVDPKDAGRALVVDEAGRPALREPGDPAPRPMALQAWCTLPGLTLLVLAPYLPQPPSRRRTPRATLVLGRDGVPDEAWRRLHVWLRWIERGRLERSTLDPDRP